MSTTNIHIMRTAAELWELAGPDMWLYRWSDDGHALMQGKACDRCAMEASEFADYQRMRGAWKAGQDLAGAPMVSMLEVTADEGEELNLPRRRGPSHFARAFNVMEALLLAHERSLDEEDREEMLRRLAGQMASLKTAVLRAEEIWHEETRRPADLETSNCPWCQQQLLWAEDRGAHCDGCGYGYGDPEEDLLEAVETWHKTDFEECAADLLKAVPVEGGVVSRNVLKNMIGMAFLDGAVSQMTRPYERLDGGSDAA